MKRKFDFFKKCMIIALVGMFCLVIEMLGTFCFSQKAWLVTTFHGNKRARLLSFF